MHGATDQTETLPSGPPGIVRLTEGLGRVAVLFAREDSVYKTLPGCEVYDMARDARTYDGPWPVVAHPPCRAWGRLRTFANPRPDERNWTLAAPQHWWGHKAEKATWFYVVGCEPRDQPDLPFVLGDAAYVIQSRKREDYRPHVTKAEREHTPPELARWLVELARRCARPNARLTGAEPKAERPS